MTVCDEEGGEEEVWEVLSSLGYNRQLQLDQVSFPVKTGVREGLGMRLSFSTVQVTERLGFTVFSSISSIGLSI